MKKMFDAISKCYKSIAEDWRVLMRPENLPGTRGTNLFVSIVLHLVDTPQSSVDFGDRDKTLHQLYRIDVVLSVRMFRICDFC